jgi:MFS transporter, DHA1 family, tetracycline resistance protein
VLFFLPETLDHPRTDIALSWGQSWRNVTLAFTHPTLRVLFQTAFLYQLGFAFYANFASVFMIHKFGFTQGEIGDYFALLGAVGLVTQLFVVRRVAQRWAPAQVLRLMLWLAGLFMLIATWMPTAWAFVAWMPFFAVCSNLNQTNATGLISARAGAAVQGEVLGLNASVAALAMGIPPVLSGFLAAALSPAAPITAASLLIFLSAWVFTRRYRPAS